MQGNNKVRFELPDYVRPTNKAFANAKVTVEYDSNYNSRGETVEVSGTAIISDHDHSLGRVTMVVEDKHIRPNGHVFNRDDRHLGSVESITVTVDEQTAIDIVTDQVDHDVDRGEDEIIVQTWDKSVMKTQGFMAGTDEIRMERVC